MAKKFSESILAKAIQAYVLEYGDTQTQAGFIIEQIDGPWKKQKDYILECMTRAMNDDDNKPITYTPEIIYSKLKEEAIGWDGDDSGVFLIF